MIASIVIKDKVTERVTKTVLPEWGLVTAVRSCDGDLTVVFREMTKDEAMERVESEGLVEVYRDRHGVVYDTPEENFRLLFPNGVSYSDGKILESIDRL